MPVKVHGTFRCLLDLQVAEFQAAFFSILRTDDNDDDDNDNDNDDDDNNNNNNNN